MRPHSPRDWTRKQRIKNGRRIASQFYRIAGRPSPDWSSKFTLSPYTSQIPNSLPGSGITYVTVYLD